MPETGPGPYASLYYTTPITVIQINFNQRGKEHVHPYYIKYDTVNFFQCGSHIGNGGRSLLQAQRE